MKYHLGLLIETSASQIVEFAVALPLLAVFVVGIFDFGNAFNLKQKLNNAAREGARFASSSPTNDLSQSGAAPASVLSVRDLIDSYLQAGKVNDCGLSTQPGTWSTSTESAIFSASGPGCPGPLTLKIEREYSVQETVGTATIDVVSTRISISYPYRWQFNRVIQLVVRGASYAGVTQITTDAVMANID